MKQTPVGKIALTGLLTASAMVLSFLEGLLPALPFLPPGAKAGFSNIIIMFAAQFSGGASAICVALLKSVFVLITRGPSAFMMSLCGGLLSTFAMWLCFKCKASFIATGIVGAVVHNSAQLVVAMLITATPGLITYYPLLLVFAVVAGIITGLLLQITYPPLCTVAKKLTPSKS